MATQVLLMTDVKDLGSEGDVATVTDGYARNYLFPRKLAMPVTQAARDRLEKIRKERESSRKADMESAQTLAAKFSGVSCTITVKTSEESKMYGSVTAGDIVDVLKEHGIVIDRRCLISDLPIKELGVFDIKVRLQPEVETAFKLWVVEE